ncbi:MAG: hypothetical protein R3B98_05790 [Hyphomonas sp.]
MQAVEYRRRASIQDKGETLWQALPDRLEYYAPDGTLRGAVPYDKVQKVRLAFAPGRFQRSRFLLELTGSRSQLVLSNIHFKGVGNFEDRSDQFFPLVRAVVEGVHRANPQAAFRAGEKPAYYGLLMVFVLAAFALLALVVVALPVVPGNFTLSAIAKLVIIAFSLPLLFSWAMNARPRRFDPMTGLDKVIAAR